MKFKNNCVLIFLIASVFSARANIADVKEAFKKTLAGPLEVISELAARVDYWQVRASDAVTLVEVEAKGAAYKKTIAKLKKQVREIKDYVATHKRPFLSAAHLIAHDLDIAALKKRKNFLEKALLNTEAEQKLIATVYLPNAEKQYKKFVNAFDLFDIKWLRAHKKIQTKTRKKLIAGFDDIYKLRKPDLQALRQGYELNKRTLQEQIEKLEINRGIDDDSRITIGYGDAQRDVSVQWFEQNNPGAPDTYIK